MLSELVAVRQIKEVYLDELEERAQDYADGKYDTRIRFLKEKQQTLWQQYEDQISLLLLRKKEQENQERQRKLRTRLKFEVVIYDVMIDLFRDRTSKSVQEITGHVNSDISTAKLFNWCKQVLAATVANDKNKLDILVEQYVEEL